MGSNMSLYIEWSLFAKKREGDEVIKRGMEKRKGYSCPLILSTRYGAKEILVCLLLNFDDLGGHRAFVLLPISQCHALILLCPHLLSLFQVKENERDRRCNAILMKWFSLFSSNYGVLLPVMNWNG
ncbi:hypothetical protein SLA2020_071460 [Shorea laevis]